LGDVQLLAAARQRLLLAGMPGELVDRVARSGKVQNQVTLVAPSAGVIQALDLRPGMTVTPGATLHASMVLRMCGSKPLCRKLRQVACTRGKR
jgi:hypothetical protein